MADVMAREAYGTSLEGLADISDRAGDLLNPAFVMSLAIFMLAA